MNDRRHRRRMRAMAGPAALALGIHLLAGGVLELMLTGEAAVATDLVEVHLTASAPEPPVTAPEPPVTAPEPPVTAPQPPVTAPEPPVTAPQPPLTAPQPPLTAPQPPLTAPQPPLTAPQPPLAAPEPPSAAPEPPSAAPEPPSAAPEPPSAAPEPPSAAPEPPSSDPSRSAVDPIPLGPELTPPSPVDPAGCRPAYTAAARRARIEGEVQARFVVTREGEVRDVRLVRDLPLVGAAVRAALGRCRMHPATDAAGHPVAVVLTQAFTFRLR